MSEKEKSATEKLAEKDLVATLVSNGIGFVSGACTTKFFETAADAVLPDDLSFGTKVACGIGEVCVGAAVGSFVQQQVTIQMKEQSGLVLGFKAGKEAIEQLINQMKF